MRIVAFSVGLVLLAGTGAGAAPGKPVNASPFKTVTYSSYTAGAGQQAIQQFDPAKGTLVSASLSGSGQASFKITAASAPTATVPYTMTAGFYIYYGPASLHLTLSGSGSFPAGANPLALTLSGSGGETVKGEGLAILRGKGTLPLTFSTDLPKPLPAALGAAQVEPGDRSGSLTVTYRYLPSIRLKAPDTLPKQPVPKLPKP